MHAALSSLGAATASFDAAMDSLLATTARQRKRVQDLERRMETFRTYLRRLDDLAASKAHNGELDDRVIMMFCPGSYESALEGMEGELAKVKGELDSAQRQKEKAATSLGAMSVSNSTRSAADAAVQKSIQRDVQMDNGQAVPSDAWLDHATVGLGVGRALEASNKQQSVPLLMGEDINRGEKEYLRMLDILVQNASMNFDRLGHLDGRVGGVGGGGGGDDDESVYSVTSQMSAISVASSSTRMTARQRKRQQIMQKGQNKAPSSQMQPTLPPHQEAPTSQTSSAVAGRQQSLVGSQSYLCEVFHDSYGIGSAPARGLVDCSGFSARGTREGGTEFYPPSSHVTDLLVFNTTRSSYGMAKSAALASTGAVAPKPAKGAAEEKVSPGSSAVDHPVSTGKTIASGGGTDKPSLANLVFKADAHAETNASPTLNLPASLPDGMEYQLNYAKQS